MGFVSFPGSLSALFCAGCLRWCRDRVEPEHYLNMAREEPEQNRNTPAHNPHENPENLNRTENCMELRQSTQLGTGILNITGAEPEQNQAGPGGT